MPEIVLEKRKALGNRASSRLRRQGKIPAVVYGPDIAPEAAQVDSHDIEVLIEKIGEATVINAAFGDEKRNVLVKQVTYDKVTEKIIHVDFYELAAGKSVHFVLPLKFVGKSKGAEKGGMEESVLHELEAEALPKDLIEYLDVDISDLDIGHSLHVRDLILPEGIKVKNEPQQTVFTVIPPRKVEKEIPVVAAEEEEEEPEIIKEKGGEEEEEKG